MREIYEISHFFYIINQNSLQKQERYYQFLDKVKEITPKYEESAKK